MKRNLLICAVLTSLLFCAGCYTSYVSDMESYYFTKNCKATSILILSSQESSQGDLNKNLCTELNNMFKTKGFTVNEYCPVKFDSVEYKKIMEQNHPEFTLCILPEKHAIKNSNGEKKLPYKVEALYRRESGKISSVYLGTINIGYSETKKGEILKDASGKIFNTIVDNNVIDQK
jgi:hypothetical protein